MAKKKTIKLTIVQKQALCSVISERYEAERKWQEKVKLQTEVVDAILQECGFSTDATMDLHQLDFDSTVKIAEAEKK